MIVNILELLFMIIVSVLVALFMSAPVGLTFLLIIIIGLVLSFGATIAAKLMRAVTVTVRISSPALYKGETAKLTIEVKNGTILPVPDLRVKLLPVSGAGISGENSDDKSGDISGENTGGNSSEKKPVKKGELIRFAVAGRASHSYSMEYSATRRGLYTLGIESVRMGDFLGLFSFSYPVKLLPEVISVFPNIKEINTADSVFTAAVEANRDNPNEDTLEQNNIFGGFPGYNHREYVPGDPIKRINRKLSAKRGVLLLRLDDESETNNQNILLSPFSDSNEEREEAAIEKLLGYAQAFVKSGLTADVYIYDEGYFCKECKALSDITELQTYFAGYQFIKTEPEPPENLSDVIIISPLFDTSFSQYG
ncbi:MAG: DUF58 domain-containing protein [Ruminococcus sp.]|jgi:uncharacterized protein (DUF58 family)|nr:DUF58 domain-containing protein [Ruminococcus sp.]